MVNDLRKDIVESLTGEKKLKENLIDTISWYELRRTGLKWINGGDVMVKNLKIKNKEKIVKADITLIRENMGDDEYYVNENIKGCIYPFKLFKELKNGSN